MLSSCTRSSTVNDPGLISWTDYMGDMAQLLKLPLDAQLSQACCGEGRGLSCHNRQICATARQASDHSVSSVAIVGHTGHQGGTRQAGESKERERVPENK